MSLPVLNSPEFTVNLPSGKKVKMRSMLMKEYKLLMMAKESPDNQSSAIMQTLSNCIVDNITLEDLSLIDVEYLFVQLHISSNAKSKNVLNKTCPKCKTANTISIDLSKQVISSNPTFKSIKHTVSNVELVFDEPPFGHVVDLLEGKFAEDQIEQTLRILSACITSVKSGDRILVLGDDYTVDDAYNMIENLSIDELLTMSGFIKDLPRITMHIGFECSNEECNHKEHITLKGISDFFEYL